MGELFSSITPCTPTHWKHSNDRMCHFEGPGGGSGEGAPITPTAHLLLHWDTEVEPSKSVVVLPGQAMQ